jgi:hypothetical protein
MGGFLAGFLILFLMPALEQESLLADILSLLVLPFYIIHQLEERDDDRLRK